MIYFYLFILLHYNINYLKYENSLIVLFYLFFQLNYRLFNIISFYPFNTLADTRKYI